MTAGVGLRRPGRWKAAAVALAGVCVLAACGSSGTKSASGGSGSSGSSGSSGGGTITFGQLLPFTGTKAFLSSWATHGDAAAVYDVNHHGGVMGKMLKATSADDAGDEVDAVPALRKLLAANPAFIVGPYSLTIEAVVRTFDPSKVVDYVIGGTTQLDNMNYKYVFRTTASDSAEVVAMAYYAVHHGYTRAAYIFDNSANTQGLVAPLTKSYEAQGGHVVDNETIVPDQSSYRSELTKLLAAHPDVIFAAFDQQTATTLFSDLRQLGGLHIPIVGEDVLGSPGYAKAMGQPAASKYLFTVSGASPGGQAYQHYLNDYQAVYGTKQILSSSYNMYDSVIISALAMTAAHSTDPSKWVNYVTQVSNPPGTMCYTYASCVSLLKAGKKINYEGATGPEDFNAHHNTFSGFAVSGFTPADQLTQVSYVNAAQVGANAG